MFSKSAIFLQLMTKHAHAQTNCTYVIYEYIHWAIILLEEVLGEIKCRQKHGGFRPLLTPLVLVAHGIVADQPRSELQTKYVPPGFCKVFAYIFEDVFIFRKYLAGFCQTFKFFIH